LAINDKAVDDRAAEVIYLHADPIYVELRVDARFTVAQTHRPARW